MQKSKIELKDEDKWLFCKRNPSTFFCEFKNIPLQNGYASRIECKECIGFEFNLKNA